MLGRPPQTRKRRKTVQDNTVILAPKRPLPLSKFSFNSKYDFQASFCITNPKYYMHEASAKYGRRRGLHRQENVAKQCKTVQNSAKQCKTVILAPNRAVQLSKFKFLNSEFEFQASFCITNPNITHIKHLRSMGAGEASTDEKRSKNSANSAKR